MISREGAEAFHVSRTVLADIIRVFLVGLPWETVDMGDMITDPVTNEVWCRWREVQGLRPMIVNHFKRSEATKVLAVEMEKVFGTMPSPKLTKKQVETINWIFDSHVKNLKKAINEEIGH